MFDNIVLQHKFNYFFKINFKRENKKNSLSRIKTLTEKICNHKHFKLFNNIERNIK
jgi:hypothetical protein